MSDNVNYAKEKIRAFIRNSKVPEDPIHAENVLEWVMKLKPNASQALQIAALAHDIERADESRKIKRSEFEDYDQFKKAHALNSALILKEILCECRVNDQIIDEACRLVELHEVGGTEDADILKDADSISFFEVNVPFYLKREGYEETLRRCKWGYARLSPQMKEVCRTLSYSDPVLDDIIKKVFSGSKDS